ncbi:hypothetical protein ACIP6X_28360 [Streptomyces coeruleorubidus]|uniref:hypothetical protein n=1 Tax=Streptomyces coeruleorubidus TaxID=116188 RepID=UPI00380577CF
MPASAEVLHGTGRRNLTPRSRYAISSHPLRAPAAGPGAHTDGGVADEQGNHLVGRASAACRGGWSY